MPTELPKLAPLEDDTLFALSPAPRPADGPGPVNADPRVLHALATQLLGQFDPQFRAYMKETMALYRRRVRNAQPVDAARRRHGAGGDRMRNGIGDRARRARPRSVVRPLRPVTERNRAARRRATSRSSRRNGAPCSGPSRWKLRSCAARPNSSPSARATRRHDGAAARCARTALPAYGAMLQVDATATSAACHCRSMRGRSTAPPAGLQKCLAGPSGSGPITLSDRIAETVLPASACRGRTARRNYIPGQGCLYVRTISTLRC